MDLVSEIITRRSVRKWTGEPVSTKDIMAILDAACNAPSAGNEQAWQFVVVSGGEKLSQWGEHCRNVLFLKNAPMAILVCRDIAAEKYSGYSVHDCCAATENILLAVHSLGLGAVWGNIFESDVPYIQEIFGIPEDVIPFSVVPVGHYDKKDAVPESRFNPDKVHWNKFSAKV